MGKSLVALDTDHIKKYVFATDKLKEIRGASSILDRLNRIEMERIVHEEDPDAQKYANGGSGLFLVSTDSIDKIRQQIHSEFHNKTFGGATVTFAVQDIPDSINDPEHEEIENVLELLRCRLREAKDSQLLQDHMPFLHMCSCAPVTPAVCDTPKFGIRMKDVTQPYKGIDTVTFVSKTASKTMLSKIPSMN